MLTVRTPAGSRWSVRSLGLPLVASIGGIAIASLLWLTFRREADAVMRAHVEDAAAELARRVEGQVVLRAGSLARLAGRFERAEEGAFAAAIADAGDYLREFPELAAIGARDASGATLWHVPSGASMSHGSAAAGISVGRLRAVPVGGSDKSDPRIEWETEAPDRFGRRVSAVCRLRLLLERALAGAVADATLRYEIRDSGRTLLAGGVGPDDALADRVAFAAIRSLPGAVFVAVSPSSRTIGPKRGLLPDLVLVGGVFASLLLGYSLFVSRRLQAAAIVQSDLAVGLRAAVDRESRARALFETLFDASPDAIVLVDSGGRIGMANREAVRLFEWSKDELVGQLVETLIPERFRSPHVGMRDTYFQVPISRPMSSGRFLMARTKHGSELPVSISLAPVEVEGKLMALAVVRDVSGLKRVQAALEASRLRYERFFSGTPTGAVLSRPGGAIVSCNPAFAEMFGFPSPEVATGTNSESLYPDPLVRRELLAELRRVGSVRSRALTLRRVDGTPVPILANIVAERNAVGEVVELMSHIVDLSAMRAMEERLRDAAKLDVLGRLAGGIAHDFNNILTAISGYGGMLLDALPPDRREHRWARDILASSERAAALTRQLLSFSRRHVLQLSPLDLGEVAASMVPMLERIVGENHAVDVIRASVIGLVCADRSQVEQVVLNLVVNARDAMPRGGPIRIVLEGVAPTDQCPERRVRLSVVDVGTGMTAETRARVFEPFFTSKENGTGLGMATVLSIVEQCGGSIDVQSELGLGTTISVCLREVCASSEGCADAPIPGPLPPRAGPPAAVLVVDDCPEIVEIIRLILGAREYEVRTAASAEEALEVVRAGHLPQLLLTDVVLPGRSGRELGDAIAREFKEIPVLYISGYSADEPLRRRLEAGEGMFLEKPFTASELIFAVERALAGSLGERGA